MTFVLQFWGGAGDFKLINLNFKEYLSIFLITYP